MLVQDEFINSDKVVKIAKLPILKPLIVTNLPVTKDKAN